MCINELHDELQKLWNKEFCLRFELVTSMEKLGCEKPGVVDKAVVVVIVVVNINAAHRLNVQNVHLSIVYTMDSEQRCSERNNACYKDTRNNLEIIAISAHVFTA